MLVIVVTCKRVMLFVMGLKCGMLSFIVVFVIDVKCDVLACSVVCCEVQCGQLALLPAIPQLCSAPH